MSLRAGNSVQPLSVAAGGRARAAPQRGQAASAASASAPHHWQRALAFAARGGGGVAAAAARGTALPQPSQKFWPSRSGVPQFTQNMGSLGVMVHVHGLNSDAAGARHPREAHVGSPEQPGAQPLD